MYIYIYRERERARQEEHGLGHRVRIRCAYCDMLCYIVLTLRQCYVMSSC